MPYQAPHVQAFLQKMCHLWWNERDITLAIVLHKKTHSSIVFHYHNLHSSTQRNDCTESMIPRWLWSFDTLLVHSFTFFHVGSLCFPRHVTVIVKWRDGTWTHEEWYTVIETTGWKEEGKVGVMLLWIVRMLWVRSSEKLKQLTQKNMLRPFGPDLCCWVNHPETKRQCQLHQIKKTLIYILGKWTSLLV